MSSPIAKYIAVRLYQSSSLVRRLPRFQFIIICDDNRYRKTNNNLSPTLHFLVLSFATLVSIFIHLCPSYSSSSQRVDFESLALVRSLLYTYFKNSVKLAQRTQSSCSWQVVFTVPTSWYWFKGTLKIQDRFINLYVYEKNFYFFLLLSTHISILAIL